MAKEKSDKNINKYTDEQKPRYKMALDYSDGTLRKFVWDNGWKECLMKRKRSKT